MPLNYFLTIHDTVMIAISCADDSSIIVDVSKMVSTSIESVLINISKVSAQKVLIVFCILVIRELICMSIINTNNVIIVPAILVVRKLVSVSIVYVNNISIVLLHSIFSFY